MEWKLQGQEHVRKILERQVESNQLFPAYFFCGRPGSGRLGAALQFSRALGAASTVFEAGDGNLQVLREFAALSKKKAAVRQVLIINQFHELDSLAFNVLLRAVEEVRPENAIFIFISDRDFLPATLASRSQRVQFVNNGADDAVTDEELAALQSSFVGDRLLWAVKMAETDTGEIIKFLQSGVTKLRQRILDNPSSIRKQLQLLIDAIQNLERNHNKKLVLEKIAINWN